MSYLPEFLTVAAVHLLAVMSPGPDFALVSKNSLLYSRRIGVYTALGFALGIAVHITYSLVGIAFIISRSHLLFTMIKLCGAGYLIYIGYKLLRSKKTATQTEIATINHPTAGKAILSGFLTNALNPKASLFFLSLFTQVIDPHTPIVIQMLFGVEMMTMTFVWFGSVALALSHGRIKQKFIRVQHYLEKVFGAMLIALGIKIAVSK